MPRHIKLNRLSPTVGDIGGGTLVNVTGENLRNYGDAKCRFGAVASSSLLMPATVVSLTLLRCFTPPYPAESLRNGRREVVLEVTLNGVDFTRSVASTVFAYYDLRQVAISHLSPSGGPMLGDTRVTIRGHAFEGPGNRGIRGELSEASPASIRRSALASCVWLRPNATCIDGHDCRRDCARAGPCAMKAAATFVDRQTVICASPPALFLPNTSAAAVPLMPPSDGSFTLDLSFDESTYSALGMSYTYYNPHTFGVSFLDPLGGPSTGDTAVLVLGSGFTRLGSTVFNRTDPDLTDGTHCLWGADPFTSNQTTRTLATILSASRALCRSPPFTGHLAYHRRSVPLSLILNGDEAAATRGCEGCSFTYYDPVAARITTIDTRGGPVDGGTWVRFEGDVLADFGRRHGPPATLREMVPTDGRTPDQRAKHAHQRDADGAIWTPYEGVRPGGGGAWLLQCRFGPAGHSDGVLAYESSYEWSDLTNAMHANNLTKEVPWQNVPMGGSPSTPDPVVWCQAPPLTADNAGHFGSYKAGHPQWVTLDLTLNGQDYIGNGATPFLYYPLDSYQTNCSATDVCTARAHDAYVRRYRGFVNVTASGRTCQAWSAFTPHVHSYTAEAYPADDLVAHNYCRQPGGLRHNRPWCHTTDVAVRWEVCDVGVPDTEESPTPFLGVHVERIHPFGGPQDGGTSVTLIGSGFRILSSRGPTGMLCNFGEGAALTPRGGPAMRLADGAHQGSLPWHVPATLLNGTHARCVSPPVANMSNGTYASVPLEIAINAQLADRTSSAVQFEYYGPATLSARWLYPTAGPKPGGTRVTIYGTGFKSLGLSTLSPPDLHGGQSAASRGIKCVFGSLPMVDGVIVYPIGSDLAKPALGDDPLTDTDDEPLASAIECIAPPWTNASAYGGDETGRDETGRDETGRGDQCRADDGRALCATDEPKVVCVRVTLNDDPMQTSNECVQFTYYDE